MKQKKMILFDLDGTISNPKIGITKSVQYALRKMGRTAPSMDELEYFIGPPLQESFRLSYGMTDAEANEAIAYYRERFTEKGMFENVLYEGMESLLKQLQDAGCMLAVATSKPTVFAEDILDYFQIASYFTHIHGSHLDGSRVLKAEIIDSILQQYPDANKADIVMIGDRKHDMIGAASCGIDGIGVTYGFGDEAELTAAKASTIVHSTKELAEILPS